MPRRKVLIAIIGILILLPALLLVILYLFPYSLFNEDLRNDAQTRLAALGIRAEIEDMEFSMPPQLGFSRLALDFPLPIQMTPQGVFLPLSLPVVATDGKLQMSLWNLLFFRSVADWQLNLYGGKLSGKSDGSVTFPASDLSLKGENIELGDHPVFQSNGISALLNFSFQGQLSATAAPLPFQNGELSVQLEQGYYGGGHMIRGIVALPAMEDLQLKADAQVDKAQVLVKKAEIECSLGSATGRGHIRFGKTLQHVERGTLRAELQLTDAGVKAFGGYLALAARRSPENPPANWKILIRKRPGKVPEVNIKPQ